MVPLNIARHEFKYLIRPGQIPSIQRFLLQYCAEDLYSRDHGWYSISSLYLDNDSYQLYRDTEDGLPWRFKLRIRAYGAGGAPVKFEVKRRANDLILKSSVCLAPDLWRRVAPAGLAGISAVGALGSGEFVRLVEKLRAAPKMLVQYERRAFSSLIDDYVRVTFDRRINCRPAAQWTFNSASQSWRPIDDPSSFGELESLCVLELKFRFAPPVWLQDLVTSFGLVRRGFSKYGRAVRRARAASEPAWGLLPVPILQPGSWRCS
jgi:hypothetical protein